MLCIVCLLLVNIAWPTWKLCPYHASSWQQQLLLLNETCLIESELKYAIHNTIYWTDSTVVLQYIPNESRFQTFVANRVTMIHDPNEVFDCVRPLFWQVAWTVASKMLVLVNRLWPPLLEARVAPPDPPFAHVGVGLLWPHLCIARTQWSKTLWMFVYMPDHEGSAYWSNTRVRSRRLHLCISAFCQLQRNVQGDIQRQWYQFYWRKTRAERKHWSNWTKPKSTIVSEWTTFSGHLNLPRREKYSKRWGQAQCLANSFCKIWMKDYVPALQTRQKWCSSCCNFAVGDLVLVVDETMSRGHWPMGLFEELMFPDSKGYVRHVKVKTATSVNKRTHELFTIVTLRTA